MRAFFQNLILLNGWVRFDEEKLKISENSFNLIQNPFIENFKTAFQDSHTVSIKVVIHELELLEEVRSYLKTGDRITVYGRIIEVRQPKSSKKVLAVEALNIERSEMLRSLRYFNHEWNQSSKRQV